jgi:hypothetical protein
MPFSDQQAGVAPVPEDRIKIGQLSPGDVALLKNLAEESAERAINKCFVAMGLDPKDPIRSQEDFALMRDVGVKNRDAEYISDMNWVRRSRKRGEGALGKALATAIGLSVVGGAHALYAGLQSMLGKQ